MLCGASLNFYRTLARKYGHELKRAMSDAPPPPPAAQPGSITVPLPPGMTVDQFLALQKVVVNLAIAMAVAVGIIIWDFVSMIPTERELYRDKDRKQWKAPATWAFMVLRYAGILALFPGLFFTSIQNDHCQVTASVSQVGVILVTGSAGVIFAYRVFAIWRFNKFVVGGVSFLWVFTVASWIAAGSQLRASQGPPTNFGSNCILHPVPSWQPLPFASSVLYDVVVLVLTLVKLRGDRIKAYSIGSQIRGDNVLYFVIVTATNIAALVINSLGPEHDDIKPVALPFPTLLTAAMGARVYINLRMYNKKINGELSGSIPTHSSGTTRSAVEDTIRLKNSNGVDESIRIRKPGPSDAIPLGSMKNTVSVHQHQSSFSDGDHWQGPTKVNNDYRNINRDSL
ncbi:hypothetical protein JR316_0001457 [Psilocybe cubensis]|uniref:Uncharacterized protein n=2 Tax=Psilocybe cubensis TaxID=181762 RepID=A0ACB8HI06_PSICU|nr:hypothetical protein JR316_0001457 [Psilocybe cubensis]KAH9487382.1 hypothetical protein JR316_0001457 [Psilocybe cubensis]